MGCQQCQDTEKSLAYYKSAAMSSRVDPPVPPHVPCRVRISKTVCGDGPYRSTRIEPGEYDCQCNRFGAVSVVATNGQNLGLRLDEFEPIAWRENP